MGTFTKHFIPPHCPNPKCLHHNGFKNESNYKRAGYFRRQSAPFRIQRFTCLTCRKSFSTQTFSVDYWQKKPGLGRQIFFKLVGCMANRQIARDLGVSPATVDRQVARLARHCLLYHLGMIKGLKPPREVVIDGFESFEWSQYYPIYLNIAVEKGTEFFWYFTDSPMRRKGRMTPQQRKRRQELEERLGRPDPKAIEKDTRELLEFVLKGVTEADVYSDCHQAYPRSIKGLLTNITHHVTPGSEHRDQDNKLWEVNHTDLLIRHNSSNHKRETIAWSKRRQGAAERLLVFLVWRNYVELRRVKDRGSGTPAMARGLTERPLTPEEILSTRLFPSHEDLPDRWAKYYERSVETRPLAVNTRHDLTFAF